MRRTTGTLALLIACGPRDYDGPDVSERLGVGEVRAGVIADEQALFAGISAEGRVGDVKIYNDRVQFIVQGKRPGSLYLEQGGSIIDADVVRPEGELGRDAVDEWQGMYGLGRLVEVDSISIVDAGSAGESAIVRVIGHESPMGLIQGVLESTDFPENLGMTFTTDFVLEPDSNLLEVRTTIVASQDALVQPGDMLLGGLEMLEAWDPTVGLEAPGRDRDWSGLVGLRNDVAYAVALPSGDINDSSMEILGSLLQMATAFGEPIPLGAGESSTFTRWYGVGRDLAQISDAIADRRGTSTEVVSGTVTAPDGVVAGARVNVLVDGRPYTLAVTDASGVFAAKVPAGASTSLLAVGRGPGRFPDFASGFTSYGPYAAPGVQRAVLDALVTGEAGPPAAEGRGVGTPADPLALGEPAGIVVSCADGLPFEVRVSALAAEAPVDPALVAERTGGFAAIGWARDGEVRLLVEPGDYRVVVHRGIRYELDEVEVTAIAGVDSSVTVTLPEAYTADGYLLADPHMHASPSSDTNISMEDRILGAAGVGLQLHFGTDHDGMADYRPIVTALGLDGVLRSIVSDEVSPVQRGHMNIYPVEPDPEAPNNGAWAWWADPVGSTQEEFDVLRARQTDFVLQSNHPLDSGLGSSAGWSPGQIRKGSFWSPDFDAVEVQNRAAYDEHLPFFVDLQARGVIVTPIGASDAHGHLGAGLSATFLGVGTSDVTAYTDDLLREAMAAHRTIVTRGPFLELSIPPGSAVSGAQTLTVTARSPSWIVVDRLILWRDGVEVERIDGTTATFAIDPAADASYWVTAEGDAPMQPIWSQTPWAMSAPIRVDATGDGWTAPLPALTVSD